MQRWWFMDETANLAPGTATPSSSSSSSCSQSIDEKTNTKLWTFKVLVNNNLLENERIAITGDSSSLGNWKPENIIILNHDASMLFVFFLLHCKYLLNIVIILKYN